MNILIHYSTVDGQTLRICKWIQAIAGEQGHHAVVADIENHESFDPALFSSVVVGASIRYGRHRPSVVRYLRSIEEDLRDRFALFSVSIVARKPEKNSPDTNPYMKKLLKQIGWRPLLLEVFAGRLDYPSYGFFDRNMIRFIMQLTGGPTDTSAAFEFTDWTKVDAFAREVCR